ncbi:hypothetical protein EK904_014633 [Melospiza melodia maxima]|nr:hypothetical protein EK904_014633 [Melospiza melodia maxima]
MEAPSRHQTENMTDMPHWQLAPFWSGHPDSSEESHKSKSAIAPACRGPQSRPALLQSQLGRNYSPRLRNAERVSLAHECTWSEAQILASSSRILSPSIPDSESAFKESENTLYKNSLVERLFYVECTHHQMKKIKDDKGKVTDNCYRGLAAASNPSPYYGVLGLVVAAVAGASPVGLPPNEASGLFFTLIPVLSMMGPKAGGKPEFHAMDVKQEPNIRGHQVCTQGTYGKSLVMSQIAMAYGYVPYTAAVKQNLTESGHPLAAVLLSTRPAIQSASCAVRAFLQPITISLPTDSLLTPKYLSAPTNSQPSSRQLCLSNRAFWILSKGWCLNRARVHILRGGDVNSGAQEYHGEKISNGTLKTAFRTFLRHFSQQASRKQKGSAESVGDWLSSPTGPCALCWHRVGARSRLMAGAPAISPQPGHNLQLALQLLIDRGICLHWAYCPAASSRDVGSITFLILGPAILKRRKLQNQGEKILILPDRGTPMVVSNQSICRITSKRAQETGDAQFHSAYGLLAAGRRDYKPINFDP